MGNCHLPAPVPPSWLATELHWPSLVCSKYRITGFRSGHAPGRSQTRTTSPRGLNPLAERVPTAFLFFGTRGFPGAPARIDPCTEPGRHFMSARTTPDSR